MTDLHCHLLPGVDDGARDASAAAALLAQAERQGIRQIALTPHYHPQRIAPETFLARREAAFARLRQIAPDTPVSFRLGAEVFYSPELIRMDAAPLCIAGTHVMLLEFDTQRIPYYAEETFDALLSRGVTPLIAHIERYAFLRADPGMLEDWIEIGCLTQVNAGAVLSDRHGRRYVMRLIRDGLAHVMASDAHSPEHRSVNLRDGLAAVRRALGADAADRLQQCASGIFSGSID